MNFPERLVVTLVTVSNTDRKVDAPGLAIAGVRNLVVASTKALVGPSGANAKKFSLPLGSRYSVSGPQGISDATVVRSSQDRNLSTLLLDEVVCEQTDLTPIGVVRHDLVEAWNGAAWFEFEVSDTRDVGRFRLMRLDAANPELNDRFLGSPVRRGAVIVGVIGKRVQGSRFDALTLSEVRRELPVQDSSRGTDLYALNSQIVRQLGELQGRLGMYNSTGLTETSCRTVQPVYQEIVNAMEMYSDADPYGAWPLTEARQLRDWYFEWNDVVKGPRGQARRTVLWQNYFDHRNVVFNEVRTYDPDHFAATIGTRLQGMMARLAGVNLVAWQPDQVESTH
jgi:hypothetical protein